MNIAENKKKIIILLVFAFIIGIRFINITMPILEGTAARQTQTAMMARNFFRYGFDILYPRVDFMGSKPGYMPLEFPILPALAAVGYIVIGSVQEWIGRFVIILFFSGSIAFLYKITKKIFDQKTAILAVLVYGLSPLSIIFSRAFMPDFIMLFFCIGSIYFMYRYYRDNALSGFWYSCIFSCLALLAKPHSFYIAIPLIYLLWQKQRFKLLSDIKNWIFLIIVIMPCFLWFTHAGDVMRQMSPVEAYNYEFTNWFQLKRFFNARFYLNLINIYSGIFLTPIGLLLFILALFLKENRGIILAWLSGTILFLIMFNTHIDDPYYNLNLLPIASILIARMIVLLKDTDYRFKNIFVSKACVIIILAITALFILRYGLYAYIVPKGYRYVVEAGKSIQKISDKDALIIASAAGGSQALYFCDRKGWSFLLPRTLEEEQSAINRLNEYIGQGASYFLSAKIDDFEKTSAFKDNLFKNYKLIDYQKGRFIVFKLR